VKYSEVSSIGVDGDVACRDWEPEEERVTLIAWDRLGVYDRLKWDEMELASPQVRGMSAIANVESVVRAVLSAEAGSMRPLLSVSFMFLVFGFTTPAAVSLRCRENKKRANEARIRKAATTPTATPMITLRCVSEVERVEATGIVEGTMDGVEEVVSHADVDKSLKERRQSEEADDETEIGAEVFRIVGLEQSDTATV